MPRAAGAGAGAASGSSARAIARDGSSASLQSQGTDAPQAGDDDSKVLRDLMEGSLMSAVDHAKIEGASSRDRQIMDQEAARIAQRVRGLSRRCLFLFREPRMR